MIYIPAERVTELVTEGAFYNKDEIGLIVDIISEREGINLPVDGEDDES